ncbi:hypothetical protein CYMTET_26159 [Cymbomonas tetramitiformis]|uniref:Uncharacterized protein n=1 Tax=Cymbomonas tetramitiformis TaxID=36881 RepID=A0AAE0FSF0_9CHLO|nr:hypothetical protein CYMTET_26159 [Cymbomonas tetramitiformis]
MDEEFLREQLASSDRQHDALILVIQELSGGQSIGGLMYDICENVILGSNSASIKSLAYDIVRMCSLEDSEWESVTSAITQDLSGPDDLCFVSVSMIPVLPEHCIQEQHFTCAGLFDRLVAPGRLARRADTGTLLAAGPSASCPTAAVIGPVFGTESL